MPKDVSAKCEVKDVFDKTIKVDALKAQMKKTIERELDKTKGALVFTDKVTTGYILTVTLNSLTTDDEKKPDELEAKVTIVGVAVGSTATGFKATGSSKVKGINPKKLEEEAKFIVDDALGKLMAKQAVPQMLKKAV